MSALFLIIITSTLIVLLCIFIDSKIDKIMTIKIKEKSKDMKLMSKYNKKLINKVEELYNEIKK